MSDHMVALVGLLLVNAIFLVFNIGGWVKTLNLLESSKNELRSDLELIRAEVQRSREDIARFEGIIFRGKMRPGG